jgi:hypothetical protein
MRRGKIKDLKEKVMRIKKTMIVLAMIVSLLAVGSCASSSSGNSSSSSGQKSEENRNPVIQNDPGKPFATVTNSSDLFKEGGSGSLTINNQASFDVIIFAGKVSNNTVLGGIRANKSRTFDLSKISLPAKNGSFLIRAASFTTYSSKNNRITENEVLYSGLVVYDLNNPKDKTNLNIFAGISQSEREYIYVSNTSKFVLELRLDNPNGEKIATLAPLQENKRIFLTPLAQGMPYSFYATYVYIDPATNEIKSFVARERSERQRRIPSTDGVNPMPFPGPKDTSDISYLIGFLRMKNDTSESLNFMDGTTWLADQKGRRLVESGQFATFELPAMSGVAGQVYTNLNMEFDSTKTLRMNSFSVRPGVVYDLIISTKNGNPAYDIRETAYKDKLEDMRVSLFLGD